MSSVYDLLRLKDNLTEVECFIADFILQNPESVSDMSIHTLATLTHTSPATITRFCQKLNLSGYKHFKIALVESRQRQLLSENTSSKDILVKEQTEFDIIERIGTLERNAIMATQLTLKPETIHAVVEAIQRANNIYAIAVSDSFIRLLDFQNKMLKINYYVRLAMLQPEQTFLSAQARKGDVALVISYSGETAEVVNATRILKDNDVTIIALTANTDSIIAKVAKFTIVLPSIDEEDVMTRGFYTRIAIDYALDIVYASLYRTNSEANATHIIKTSNQYLNK